MAELITCAVSIAEICRGPLFFFVELPFAQTPWKSSLDSTGIASWITSNLQLKPILKYYVSCINVRSGRFLLVFTVL